MTQHVATVHEGKRQFKCEVCDKKFKSKRGMKGHTATFHERNKKDKI